MLKMRLLKTFEASSGEEALTGLGSQVRRLLVYLALHANTRVERETICRQLKTVRWSEEDRAVAALTKETLRQQLHRLGNALGADLPRLQCGSGTVCLNLEGADVDVLRFKSLVAHGSRGDLEQAIQLYQGPLLAHEQHATNYWREEWEPWVAPIRAELHNQYLEAREKLRAASATVIPSPLPPLEFPGGGVPLGSPFYIERPQDAELDAALQQPGQTLLIKGPRQVGKTSLLNRALHTARQSGASVIHSDCQNIALSDLDTPAAFFFALADEFAYQLQLETPPEAAFDSYRAPSTNFERYVRKQVLAAPDTQFVWGIDEADRLFPCTFRDEIFGKLRAWHNERSRTNSPLNRLTVVIAYSTEAHLFIRDPNMSPFNVGTKFILQDLTEEQTAELNRRYGSPLTGRADLVRLQRLTGGHPYLVRLCLHTLCRHGATIEELEAQAERSEGIFAEHLARIRFALSRDEGLKSVVHEFVRNGAPPTEQDYVRLCAAGLMAGASPGQMQARCSLYQRFLERYLP